MKSWLGTLCIVVFLVAGCDSKTDNQSSEKSLLEKESIKTATKETKEAIQKGANAVDTSLKNVAKKVDEAVIEPVKNATKNAQQALEKGTEAISKGVDEAKEATKKMVEKTATTVAATAHTVSKKATDITKSATSSSADLKAGERLYKPCIACHGPKAKQKALGRSKAIAGWDAKKTADSLNGYKNKTYGGAMKTIMYSQVGKLSKEQIDQLSAYISTL